MELNSNNNELTANTLPDCCKALVVIAVYENFEFNNINREILSQEGDMENFLDEWIL